MSYLVEEINASQTIAVRQIVLRKGRPLEDCSFEGDNDPQTKHLGVMHNNNIVAVATLIKNNSDYFCGTQTQLRGMAVLPKHQGKGLGTLLLNQVESILIERKINIIWCNARINALAFYKKMGFETYGNAFEIKFIGLHYTMAKTITPL